MRIALKVFYAVWSVTGKTKAERVLTYAVTVGGDKSYFYLW